MHFEMKADDASRYTISDVFVIILNLIDYIDWFYTISGRMPLQEFLCLSIQVKHTRDLLVRSDRDAMVQKETAFSTTIAIIPRSSSIRYLCTDDGSRLEI